MSCETKIGIKSERLEVKNTYYIDYLSLKTNRHKILVSFSSSMVTANLIGKDSACHKFLQPIPMSTIQE